MSAEGVLYGQKLHRPADPISGEPSRDPGNGEDSTSACGFFTGIVYDREWLNSHHPDLIECSYCFPRTATAPLPLRP